MGNKHHTQPHHPALPLLQWMQGKDSSCYLNGGSIPASSPAFTGPAQGAAPRAFWGVPQGEELHPWGKAMCGHAWIPWVLTKIVISSVQSPSWCIQKAKHSLIEFHTARRCGWASSDAPGDAAPIHPHM